LLIEIRQNEARERMIEGAWIGFQMGAGGELNFGDYLKKMGLLEGQAERMPEAREMSAADAIAKAEKILRRARESKI